MLISGRPEGSFNGQRGLRQGDPLSPFLFILVADILGQMIDSAKRHGVIEGFKVGDEGIHVTHLQYADDSLLFVKNSERAVANMMHLVHTFYTISGLKLNLSKCGLLGINVSNDLVSEMAGR
ncbi:hypothetical protein Scep_009326 [Stephania cephalantha]|uniref:Reverse transcriptase domain-containing protein n=1 Tax=Stephania cephalantha TaxID=152367 RepID=A0AAP0PG55_9MAGN